MDARALVEVTYYAVAGALLAALALFLATTPGGGWPRRALATSVAIAAVSTFTSAYARSDPAWPSALGVSGDLALLSSLASGAVFLLYPRRVLPRSVWGALQLVAFAYIALALVAWLFARPWFLDAPDMRLTLAWHWLGPFSEAVGLAGLVLMLGALSRARALPAGERRGAAVLLAGLALPVWLAPGAVATAWFAQTISGSAYTPSAFAVLPGDCCHATAVLWVVDWLVLPITAVALATRWLRTRLAMVFLGLGFALGLVGAFTQLATAWIGAVVTVTIVPYALVRHDALGGRQAASRAVVLLGIATGVGAFLLVNALVLSFDPANPLLLVVGVLLGTLAGAGALVVALPRARGLALEALETTPDRTRERLGPYRALLEQEVAAGTPRERLSERLRPVRASLGISDHEHAVLEYAMLERGALAQREVRPGKRFLDRYRVLTTLREGGAGVTHLCHDERLQRDVVIKALRGAHAGPEGLAAVIAEARALSRVRDPHVVTLLDVEQIGDEAFIVMEHVEGGSLADRLAARGPLPPPEFARVADGLLRALAAVHQAGLVHRDVKPSNVLLTASGEAKLADFGIAHLPGFETTAAANPGSASVAGTIPYMSPEQARGRATGPRSDLFSAAATLFETWAGERYLAAEPGESAVEMQLRAASAGAFERAWDGPPAMRAFWERALHPVAAERFADARSMREALERAMAPPGRSDNSLVGPP